MALAQGVYAPRDGRRALATGILELLLFGPNDAYTYGANINRSGALNDANWFSFPFEKVPSDH